MIRYTCGQCGAKLESPLSLAGELDKCPQCGCECPVPPARTLPAGPPVGIDTQPPAAAGRDITSRVQEQGKNRSEMRTVLLIIGIVTTAISQIIELAYPVSLEARIRGYTVGVYVIACIIQLLVYTVVLGGIAMIVGKLAGKWKTVSYAVFAWLFLFAGLLDLGTSIYGAHVANEVHELLRSHPELLH